MFYTIWLTNLFDLEMLKISLANPISKTNAVERSPWNLNRKPAFRILRKRLKTSFYSKQNASFRTENFPSDTKLLFVSFCGTLRTEKKTTCTHKYAIWHFMDRQWIIMKSKTITQTVKSILAEIPHTYSCETAYDTFICPSQNILLVKAL